jgi:hypothetical protein
LIKKNNPNQHNRKEVVAVVVAVVVATAHCKLVATIKPSKTLLKKRKQINLPLHHCEKNLKRPKVKRNPA